MTAWRRFDARGPIDQVGLAANEVLHTFESITLPRQATVFLADDGSHDAHRISQRFDTGFSRRGCRVSGATATTPAAMWLARFYDIVISCTASHESDDGIAGFKIASEGRPWSVGDYSMLREEMWPGIFAANMTHATLDGKSDVEAYVRSLPNVQIGREIAVIGGSQIAVSIARKAFEQAGCDVIHRVVHGLDPATVKTPPGLEPEQWRPTFLFDADGDRVGFIGPHWKVWKPTEIMLAVISCQLAPTMIWADMRTPLTVIAYAENKGHTVRFHESGREMNGLGASEGLGLKIGTDVGLGIETSLHFYWPERFGNDDGLYTALRLAHRLPKLEEYARQWTMDIAEPDELLIDHAWTGYWDALERLLSANGWRPVFHCPEGTRWEGDGCFITRRISADSRLKLHFEGPEARTMVRSIYA